MGYMGKWEYMIVDTIILLSTTYTIHEKITLFNNTDLIPIQ